MATLFRCQRLRTLKSQGTMPTRASTLLDFFELNFLSQRLLMVVLQKRHLQL